MEDRTAELRAPTHSFSIFRKAGEAPMTISGGVTASVEAGGALVISVGGEPYVILAPGQWLSVNAPPV